MRAEGRLLIFLVEVAIFDRIFGDDTALTRGFGQRHAAITRAHLAVRKYCVRGIEAELLRDRLAQFDASRIDAGGRVVAAPLSARATRHGEGRIAEARRHLV